MGFNAKYKVLVDEMGIMLPPGEIDDLQASLIAHRAHSPKELDLLGSKQLTK